MPTPTLTAIPRTIDTHSHEKPSPPLPQPDTNTRSFSIHTHACQICQNNLIHFSICACHPCAGAMLIFCIVPILADDLRKGSDRGASSKESNLKSWGPKRHLADNNKDSSLLPKSKTANEGLQGWRMGQIS